MRGKQPNILSRRTAEGKSRGGLDKIGFCIGHDTAHSYFFRLRQQTGFDNHFNDFSLLVTNFRQLADLPFHILYISLLQSSYRDDHIDFVRAVRQGAFRFKCLYLRRIIPVRKSRDGTDFQRISHIFFGLPHETRRNTDACNAVTDSLVAKRFDLRPIRFRFQ